MNQFGGRNSDSAAKPRLRAAARERAVHPMIRMHQSPRTVAYLMTALILLLAAREAGGRLLLEVLAAYALLFPFVARPLAVYTGNSPAAEKRVMCVDSINSGLASGALALALLPSASLVLTLSLNAVVVGGMRFVAVQLPFLLLGVALGQLLSGPSFVAFGGLGSSLAAAIGVVLYPMLVGLNAHRMAHSLRSTRDALAERTRQLEDASHTDPLTGLRNRRFLYQKLDALSAGLRGRRHGLVLVDIDHFKPKFDS